MRPKGWYQMSENTMKLSAGYNNCWPSVISNSTFEVESEMIDKAMVGEVHESIHEIAISQFKAYLNEVLDVPWSVYKSHKLTSWVNRYDNTEMEYHSHHGDHLSAIFYLVAKGGDIVFHDPRFFAARGYDKTFRPNFAPRVHTPKAGDLLVFPSFIYHTVRPSDQFRISVPVDLCLYMDD